MNIIIDAMGGDRAPEEIVKGACEASLIYESKLTLVGKEDIIKELLGKYPHKDDKIEVLNADDVITMEDDPMMVARAKKGCSMAVGLRKLKEEGDAFISAGSTGALHVGATLLVKNIKGVRCAAISTLLPFKRPMLLMDCGANVNVTPDNLQLWARLGALYAENVLGVKNPEVGLLNNGTEECKGTALQKEAYQILKADESINFAGNIEGKDIPKCKCDILVTDGFTGNIALKLVEGMASFFMGSLKSMFTANIFTKLSYLMMKKQLKGLKNSFDASEYGGSPILGISKPVIKAHGSSDSRAIVNSVRQAEAFIKAGITEKIEKSLAEKTAEEVNNE